MNVKIKHEEKLNVEINDEDIYENTNINNSCANIKKSSINPNENNELIGDNDFIKTQQVWCNV